MTYIKRLEVEHDENWHNWIDKIPPIQFPRTWQIQVIPPFGGALARFRVRRNSQRFVSVYLDCFQRLGYFDGPYWEVYPYRGDVGRCSINNTSELLRMITAGLREV